MKAKTHPPERPRGVRDPKKCMVQAGGRLVWIQDGQPMFWTDRPAKFRGHILLMLTKKGGTVITDVKWKQLDGKVWWRIPDWPDGNAGTLSEEGSRVQARATLKGHPVPGMARLDRIAQRAGVTLEAWGKNGRQFGYEDRLLRYKPQGKGTFLLEAFVGSSDERALEATAVCQQRRLEDLILRAAWCESCESSPCECSALTRPVPWIEAELSSREIEPGVYDLQGAPEAVRHAFERLLEDPLIDAVTAGKDTA